MAFGIEHLRRDNNNEVVAANDDIGINYMLYLTCQFKNNEKISFEGSAGRDTLECKNPKYTSNHWCRFANQLIGN